MKKQNNLPYQLSVRLPDEARDKVQYLKMSGVDMGELSRRALTQAIDGAWKKLSKKSS